MSGRHPFSELTKDFTPERRRRVDVYISSLRSYIEAAGGKLNIVAEFPEGEIAITNFSEDREMEESGG